MAALTSPLYNDYHSYILGILFLGSPLQHIATACAINLSRFFNWSNHATKAPTRTSSFARLRVHFA